MPRQTSLQVGFDKSRKPNSNIGNDNDNIECIKSNIITSTIINNNCKKIAQIATKKISIIIIIITIIIDVHSDHALYNLHWLQDTICSGGLLSTCNHMDTFNYPNF